MLVLPSSHPLVSSFEKEGADLSLLFNEPFILNQHNSFSAPWSRIFLQVSPMQPDILCEISDVSAAANMVANQKGMLFSRAPSPVTSPAAVCFRSILRSNFRL